MLISDIETLNSCRLPELRHTDSYAPANSLVTLISTTNTISLGVPNPVTSRIHPIIYTQKLSQVLPTMYYPNKHLKYLSSRLQAGELQSWGSPLMQRQGSFSLGFQ